MGVCVGGAGLDVLSDLGKISAVSTAGKRIGEDIFMIKPYSQHDRSCGSPGRHSFDAHGLEE